MITGVIISKPETPFSLDHVLLVRVRINQARTKKAVNIPASEVQLLIDEAPPHCIRDLVYKSCFNDPQLEMRTEISTEPGRSASTLATSSPTRAGRSRNLCSFITPILPPLLEAGILLHGTLSRVVPFGNFAARDVANWQVYSTPKFAYPEKIYCIYSTAYAAGNAHFLFHNAADDLGVGYTYSLAQLPYLTQWKNENSGGYVTGLESGTGFHTIATWSANTNAHRYCRPARAANLKSNTPCSPQKPGWKPH